MRLTRAHGASSEPLEPSTIFDRMYLPEWGHFHLPSRGQKYLTQSRKVSLKRGIALLLAGALVAIGGVAAANAFGFNPFHSGGNEGDRPVLMSIKNAIRYHAAVGNMEVVVEFKPDDTPAWVPGFIAGRRTLFVAAGTVDAYVDLSGLNEKDLKLSPDGKSVTVRLPEAQLDKPNLDMERSRMFDQERGIFDGIADAFAAPDQAKLYKLAETKFTAAAESSELRKRATENTKAFLTTLCGSLGVQVTFVD